MNDDFAGDKKTPMVSPLAKLEERFIETTVTKMPGWFEGHHLTWMTLAWSIGLGVFGYLARCNLHWLWASSVMIFLQWFTDCFDGALGRHRDRGLVKWGYYMDHLLDFLFMWCIFAVYFFLLDNNMSIILLFTAAFLYSALMAHAFLAFSITNAFQITYLGFGPTEVRLFFIGLNTAIIFGQVQLLEAILPYLTVILALGLCIVVYWAQKQIWKLDMADKETRERTGGQAMRGQ